MGTLPKNDLAGQAHLTKSVNYPVRLALQVVEEWRVPIFPCDASKRPLTPHGFKDATQDPQTIQAWWTQWPQAFIGVPMGRASGLVAIDVDPQGRGWYQGVQASLGPHRTHQTRRGRHLLFKAPDDGRVKNSTGQLACGVDVRGEGGYVIWWPAHGGVALGEIGGLPQVLRQALSKGRGARRLNGHALNGHDPEGGDPCDWDAERPRVIHALSELDPDCSHDEWRDAAAALSWATDGDVRGEDLFVQWSRGDFAAGGQSAKFESEPKVRSKYRSFKNDKDTNITLATLYQMVKAAGKAVPHGRPEKRANGPDRNARVLLVRADKVEEQPVDWLWKGFLARNKFHLLTGSGGVMKSTLTLALAATITRGSKWPDGSWCQKPANVIIWSGEDDLADTVKPRFRFAGGNERRCYFVRGVRSKGQKRDFDPALDMEALERACAEVGNVALIVVDPIVSIVQKDNNSASDVRRSLAPLISLGIRYHAVILGLQHFTKGSKGRDPTERVLGSGAWTQAARIVLAAAPVDEGDGTVATKMVFACTKTFHKNPGGFEYSYEEEPETEIARVVWGRRLEGTAHAIFREAEGDVDGASKLGVAKRWLEDFLRKGPQPALLIGKQALAQEIKGVTLKRAKESLKVCSLWRGRARFWGLPEG